LRPIYHFAPPSHWVNDPNGLIQIAGVYHLFYQYNPVAPVWGNMHWGHATSRDMVRWTHEPIALGPDCDYDGGGCFSGTAAYQDSQLHLLYTAMSPRDDNGNHRQTQCLATSDDHVTFRKHAANPLVAAPPRYSQRDFRDPFVWRETERWHMVVGGVTDGGRQSVLRYTSDDLTAWTFAGELFGLDHIGRTDQLHLECPNYFALDDRRVLITSRGDCSVRIGDEYDGRFHAERLLSLDAGPHVYAALTFADEADRRIALAWVRDPRSETDRRDSGWSGCLTLPRVLRLSPDGALLQTPVNEIAELRQDAVAVPPQTVRGRVPISAIASRHMEITCIIDPQDAERSGIAVDRTRVIFDRGARTVSLDSPGGVQQGLLPLTPGQTLALRVFIDGPLIELFANDRLCITDWSPGDDVQGNVELLSDNGEAKFVAMNMYTMTGF
jgi:beta-fructofuranosidase